MKWLERLLVPRRLAVVRSDGGICSQMRFRAIGEDLALLGADVKYDLSWFRRSGRDCLGLPTRNYQLDQLCPSLASPEATEGEICRLLRAGLDLDLATLRSVEDFRMPAYFSGYCSGACILRHRDLFANAMDPVVPPGVDLSPWLDFLRGGGCAVHVRRGDLAGVTALTPHGACTADYFVDAVRQVRSVAGVERFAFFSDDHEYVRQQVLPQMDSGLDCRLCDINDQRHGYLDLYLMCQAAWVVGSLGTASAFARLFSADPDVGGLVLPRGGRAAMSDYGPACGKIIYLDGWQARSGQDSAKSSGQG